MITIITVLAACILSSTIWCLCAAALSRYRGYQVEKWLREHEASEIPDLNQQQLDRLHAKRQSVLINN